MGDFTTVASQISTGIFDNPGTWVEDATGYAELSDPQDQNLNRVTTYDPYSTPTISIECLYI